MVETFVRLGETGDVVEAARMMVEWEEEDITHGQTAASERDIADWLGPFFYVAFQDGRLSGFVYGSERVSEGLAVIPKGRRYLQIDELYVRPRLRSTGIGGMLVERLMNAARDRGIERFRVYSAAKEIDRALEFYRSHGFKSWYVEMVV